MLHLTPPDSLATHFLLSSDRIIFQGLAYILTVEFFAVSRQKLAKLRGPYRYIVKLEEQPKRNQMLVGFLGDAEESPASAGPEFSRAGREAVIDLEQFAPVCDSIK